MAIFSIPLGMGLKSDNNPLIVSPFAIDLVPGESFPPFHGKIICTENDIAITTENGKELTTG